MGTVLGIELAALEVLKQKGVHYIPIMETPFVSLLVSLLWLVMMRAPSHLVRAFPKGDRQEGIYGLL